MKHLSTLILIAALIIVIAVIAGCAEEAQHETVDYDQLCVKSTNGYLICIRNENVSCEISRNYIDDTETWTNCRAAGTATDLAGNVSHWESGHEKPRFLGNADLLCMTDYEDGTVQFTNESTFTCTAARHFNHF